MYYRLFAKAKIKDALRHKIIKECSREENIGNPVEISHVVFGEAVIVYRARILDYKARTC